MSNVFLALSLTWPLAINGIFSLALVWTLEPTSSSSEACSFCSLILYGTDMMWSGGSMYGRDVQWRAVNTCHDGVLQRKSCSSQATVVEDWIASNSRGC